MTTVGRTGPAPAWDLLDFPVEVCPVVARSARLEEDLDLGRRAVLRTDRQVHLHTVSADYRLLGHRAAFEEVHEALSAQREVTRVETVVGRDGALARVIWLLGEDRAYVGPSGDAVVMAVTALNSYDGSRAWTVMPSAVRFEDGADVRVPWSGRRHVNDIAAEDLRADAQEALDALDEAVVGTWDVWATTLLDRAAYRRGVRSIAGVRAEPRVLARLDAVDGDTVWDGYCALAWYASHHVATGDRRIRDHRLLEKHERAHANAVTLAEELVEAAS